MRGALEGLALAALVAALMVPLAWCTIRSDQASVACHEWFAAHNVVEKNDPCFTR